MRVVDNDGRVFWLKGGKLYDRTGRPTGARWPSDHRFMPDAEEREETAQEREIRLHWKDERDVGEPLLASGEGYEAEDRRLKNVVNLEEKFGLLPEYWQPRVVAELNDYQFKIARMKGEFVWHDHADTDEAFFVLEGTLRIDLPDGPVEIGAGELYVVPRGVRHRPVADEEVKLLLVEPRGVVNTGNERGALTAKSDVWI